MIPHSLRNGEAAKQRTFTSIRDQLLETSDAAKTEELRKKARDLEKQNRRRKQEKNPAFLADQQREKRLRMAAKKKQKQ